MVNKRNRQILIRPKFLVGLLIIALNGAAAGAIGVAIYYAPLYLNVGNGTGAEFIPLLQLAYAPKFFILIIFVALVGTIDIWLIALTRKRKGSK